MQKNKRKRMLMALAIGFAVAVIVTAVAVWLEVAPKLLQSESGIVRTLSVWGTAARLNLPFISTDYMIDAQVWSSLQGPLDPVKAGAVYWDVVRAFDKLPPRKKREFVDSLNKLISKGPGFDDPEKTYNCLMQIVISPKWNKYIRDEAVLKAMHSHDRAVRDCGMMLLDIPVSRFDISQIEQIANDLLAKGQETGDDWMTCDALQLGLLFRLRSFIKKNTDAFMRLRDSKYPYIRQLARCKMNDSLDDQLASQPYNPKGEDKGYHYQGKDRAHEDLGWILQQLTKTHTPTTGTAGE